MHNYNEEAYKSYRKYLAQILRAVRNEGKINRKKLKEIAEEQRQAQKELDNQ